MIIYKIPIDYSEIAKIMFESEPEMPIFRDYNPMELYGFPEDTIITPTWRCKTYEKVSRFISYDTLKELNFEPESCIAMIKLRKPGTGTPWHKDPYRVHGNRPAHRYVIQCTDWTVGQYCQLEDETFTHWKAGDAYHITKDDAHLAVNFSHKNRLFITLTGAYPDSQN